jgi:archaellum component FlaG (FlaF/FlaG flagellin family)
MNPGMVLFIIGMVLAAGLAVALPTVANRIRRNGRNGV